MINYLKKAIRKISKINKFINNNNVIFDEIKINQGIIINNSLSDIISNNIQDFEYKVFSQWGEDGIIQFLIKSIEIKNKTFIEFGVEDFLESNCRFLMMKDNWSGFIVDGSKKNIESIKSHYYYWKYDLNAKQSFITAENINEVLLESNFEEDLGILSIDVDGVDYFILEAINTFKPRILILEFNSVFGVERKITVPYDQKFNRTLTHYSNLYFGASLPAMNLIAEKKGYALVGINSAGCNAFFVKSDLLNHFVKKIDVRKAFINSKFRESRDQTGNLSFLEDDQRLELIRGLPVLNVETNCIEKL